MLATTNTEIDTCINHLSSNDTSLRERALDRLFHLAQDKTNTGAILSAGGIKALVTLVKTLPSLYDLRVRETLDYLNIHSEIDAKIQQEMKEALKSLLLSSNFRLYVTHWGASDLTIFWLKPLVIFLTDTNQQIQENAMSIINKLSYDQKNVPAIVGSGAIELIVKFLKDNRNPTVSLTLMPLNCIFHLIKENDKDANNKFVSTGGLEALVDLLSPEQTNNTIVVIETLSLLAKGNQDYQNRIAEAGGLDRLVKLLWDIKGTEQLTALKALGVLIENNRFNQNLCIRKKGITILLRTITLNSDVILKEHALMAIIKLKINKDSPKDAFTSSLNYIKPLLGLLSDASFESKRKVVEILGRLAFNQNCNKAIRKAGGIGVIVSLLAHQHLQIKSTSLWALINMAEGSGKSLCAIINSKGIDTLLNLLTDPDFSVRKRLASLLTLMAANGHQHQLSEIGALQSLVALYNSDTAVQDYINNKLSKIGLEFDEVTNCNQSTTRPCCDSDANSDLKPSSDNSSLEGQKHLARTSVAADSLIIISRHSMFPYREQQEEPDSLTPGLGKACL